MEIYIRQLRFEEARKKLLEGIQQAFMSGLPEITVVHGVGTYTLRKMIIAEVAKLDYVEIIPPLINSNPGTIRLQILGPEKSVLDRYLVK